MQPQVNSRQPVTLLAGVSYRVATAYYQDTIVSSLTAFPFHAKHPRRSSDLEYL